MFGFGFGLLFLLLALFRRLGHGRDFLFCPLDRLCIVCIGLFAWFEVARLPGESAQLRQVVYTWFSVGSLRVDLGLTFDRLSGTVVLVVEVLALALDTGGTVVDVVAVVEEEDEVVPAARIRSWFPPPLQAAKATSAAAMSVRRTHLVSLAIWTCA